MLFLGKIQLLNQKNNYLKTTEGLFLFLRVIQKITTTFKNKNKIIIKNNFLSQPFLFTKKKKRRKSINSERIRKLGPKFKRLIKWDYIYDYNISKFDVRFKSEFYYSRVIDLDRDINISEWLSSKQIPKCFEFFLYNLNNPLFVDIHSHFAGQNNTDKRSNLGEYIENDNKICIDEPFIKIMMSRYGSYESRFCLAAKNIFVVEKCSFASFIKSASGKSKGIWPKLYEIEFLELFIKRRSAKIRNYRKVIQIYFKFVFRLFLLSFFFKQYVVFMFNQIQNLVGIFFVMKSWWVFSFAIFYLQIGFNV